MRKLVSTWLVIQGMYFCTGCVSRPAREDCGRFVEGCVARVEPVAKQANLAYWEAATTGKP